jgi:tRNA-2-methylthio-N6-dimethylallyladenosine synthase
MLERTPHTMHEESRQGEAYAPFASDPNEYDKKFT